MPVTIPVVAPTVMPAPPKPMTLLHVPPDTESANVTLAPIHTVSAPLIAAIAGKGFTVMTWLVVIGQGDDNVKMTVSVPEVMPVTLPEELMEAFVLVTLHVPVADPVSVVADPWHTDADPDTVAGVAVVISTYTVTKAVEVPLDTCTWKESVPVV